MQAGFACANINPAPGVRLYGFAGRDLEKPLTGIHDDIFVRACYLQQGDEQALIIGLDLLFLGSDEVTLIRADLQREMGLAPRQILLNTSHSHVGPRIGTWAWGGHTPPETEYISSLRQAIIAAAREAKQQVRPVRIMAGATKSRVPLSRRNIHEDGRAYFEPTAAGVTCDHLPVCLLQGEDGKPVCLLFSVSCHPSMTGGFEVSSEYPGAACRALDAHLGAPMSVFLQGAGGDAKPALSGTTGQWRSCTWEEVEQTGQQVAAEIIPALDRLKRVEPDLHCAMEVLQWPLLPAATKDEFAAMAADANAPEYKRLWAQRNLDMLRRGEKLPTSWPITLSAIQIGKGLRLVGLEGEAVARWGLFFLKQFPEGVTFPLGYTNGQGAYLPTSDILHEGGYEVDSYHEYWLPAQLGPGFEEIVAEALRHLQTEGIAGR
jgi:neutral ceramidase